MPASCAFIGKYCISPIVPSLAKSGVYGKVDSDVIFLELFIDLSKSTQVDRGPSIAICLWNLCLPSRDTSFVRTKNVREEYPMLEICNQMVESSPVYSLTEEPVTDK